ncbi:DnaD domain protein [Listeria monocytogenes]|nr:DnaD domain protein [Listeria monocytogenes]
MVSLKEYLAKGQTTISNLLLENYHHLGLTNDEFLLWLQLYRSHEQGNDFPDLREIASVMGSDQKEIYHWLNQLLKKDVVRMESKKDAAGKMVDYYDFTGIYERLEFLLKQQSKNEKAESNEEKIRGLYRLFEGEFGRPLSAIEYQRIGQWLDEDHYDPELIQFALREAVLNQAYSLNYIDRILLSWERKNITSKAQVEEEQKRRKKQFLQNENASQEEGPMPKIPMHNWLEGE